MFPSRWSKSKWDKLQCPAALASDHSCIHRKKKKEKNQLINQNLCKKFLVDKLSRVYLLKALLKPIKVTHSMKTDFFPVCCIHLRLVVKYKRFISEFPLKYLCGSSLLVGILQDLISAKSRLSYWDYYQKFIKLEMLIGIQRNCHSWFLMFFYVGRGRKVLLEKLMHLLFQGHKLNLLPGHPVHVENN